MDLEGAIAEVWTVSPRAVVTAMPVIVAMIIMTATVPVIAFLGEGRHEAGKAG